jgi:hypothetical protein
MTISGRIFTPFVSSSKNRRSPALDAGIGALRSFFLLLKGIRPNYIHIKLLKYVTFYGLLFVRLSDRDLTVIEI